MIEAILRGGESVAEERAAVVRRDLGLAGVGTERRGDRWFVTWYGPDGRGFVAPTGEAAQEALRRVRGAEVGGERPYAGAVLFPPANVDAGRVPDEDLRSVRRELGDAEAFTLQVAVYGRVGGGANDRDREEARRAAQAAVAELRRDGEQAFYFHGPELSTVTIGVFSADDLGLTARSRYTPSPEFERLRKAYPFNLVNGAELLERDPANPGQKRAQRSRPVEVPR